MIKRYKYEKINGNLTFKYTFTNISTDIFGPYLEESIMMKR